MSSIHGATSHCFAPIRDQRSQAALPDLNRDGVTRLTSAEDNNLMRARSDPRRQPDIELIEPRVTGCSTCIEHRD